LREDIRKRYISESSQEFNLRLFLSDFVIEMGPLDPEARDGSNSGEEIELLASNNTVNSSTAV
jgi:hypothetical protein